MEGEQLVPIAEGAQAHRIRYGGEPPLFPAASRIFRS